MLAHILPLYALGRAFTSLTILMKDFTIIVLSIVFAIVGFGALVFGYAWIAGADGPFASEVIETD